jgi:hypothetical protein
MGLQYIRAQYVFDDAEVCEKIHEEFSALHNPRIEDEQFNLGWYYAQDTPEDRQVAVNMTTRVHDPEAYDQEFFLQSALFMLDWLHSHGLPDTLPRRAQLQTHGLDAQTGVRDWRPWQNMTLEPLWIATIELYQQMSQQS